MLVPLCVAGGGVIDLDGCLGDTVPSFVRYWNRTHGTTIQESAFTEYDWSGILHCTREQAIDAFRAFILSPEARFMPPISGAQSAIARLADKYCLTVLTARIQQVETRQWVSLFYPACFSDIRFSTPFAKSEEAVSSSKVMICSNLGARFVVEDHLGNASACAGQGLTSFLIDYPWNQGKCPSGVFRVTGWQEILSALI